MENLSQIPHLQDIHLPPSASLWPLAIGWWILICLIVFLLGWLWIKLRQQAKRKQQRKQILAKLDTLEEKFNTNPSNDVIAKINVLLRQLAIHYYPRNKIASLTGYSWLQFLDHSGNTTGFCKGAGRVLIEAPYQPDTASRQALNFNKEEFFPLIRRWMTTISEESRKVHLEKNNGQY